MQTDRKGARNPRISIVPPHEYTDGADAGMLASAYGLKPDPWQQDILDVWLGRDADDKFTATTCGLSVPRQNGKNGILEMRELYGLCVLGEQILHSAHEVKTAARAFQRLASFFEDPVRYPELSDLVVRVRRTNGQESIELKNGGSIRFSARSKGAMRGFTFDLVVFDEAQYLTDEQLEAMMSTMAAAPLGNRQLIYTGTPPAPTGCGDVFGRVRKQSQDTDARNGLAWHEWSVETIGDVHDKNRWYATNPALGIRLDMSFTETECKTMSEDGFARERLGWWSDRQTFNAVFSEGQWSASSIEKAPDKSNDEKIACGVKFTPDGTHVGISVAVKQSSITYVECLFFSEIANGISWIANFAIARKTSFAQIAIDGKSNTAALYRKLIDGGFPRRGITVMATKDVCSAATMFFNAINEKEVVHTVQPLLDESALSAQKRLIGNDGGWGFGTGLVDCAPVESAAMAYWAVMTTKRNPARKLRVG